MKHALIHHQMTIPFLIYWINWHSREKAKRQDRLPVKTICKQITNFCGVRSSRLPHQACKRRWSKGEELVICSRQEKQKKASYVYFGAKIVTMFMFKLTLILRKNKSPSESSVTKMKWSKMRLFWGFSNNVFQFSF